MRSGPVRVSVVRRRFDGPRTVVARSRRCLARQTRCERFLRARSRVSVVRLVAPAGVATGDASDRLLHSETVPTRALVPRRFPAQRPNPCDAFRRIARGSLSSQSLAAPCSSTRTSLSRAAPPVRRQVARAPGSSGPPDANEAGEDRASRRGPHFGARTIVTRWRFLPPCEIETLSPLTPLSPPPCRCAGRFSAEPAHGLEGRQDRFRGGLVKGVRIADPGCLPPTDATHIPAAPRHGRNRVAFSEDVAFT